MKRLLAVLLSLAPTAALAAVAPETSWNLPRDISLEGHRIDGLLNITSVFVVILFVIMVIWMAIAMIAHRGERTADYDHGNSKHHVIAACVISAVIFFVVDGNLYVNAMKDLGEAYWNWERVKGAEVVRVEVNAHQWAWDVRYPGPDREFGTPDDIVTLNQLHVPVDTPVAVQLTSVDVIHSFYLPNLRVKTDAMPGTVNHLWFQVDSQKLAAAPSKEFDLACAQHCGTHHYKMGGKLTVHTKEEFDAWAREASVMSAADYDENGTDAKRQAHWGWKWQEEI